jgi:ethanolaminephosphotransferase
MTEKQQGTPSAHHKRRVVSVNPLVHEHIPNHLLPNLKEYKYSGMDKSIVSNYVLCYYWNFVVELLPMWLAPNVVTLIGFVISVSSTALLVGFHTMDRVFFEGSLGGMDLPPGEYPGWVWLYAAFALFAYQTLDAVDGKQARRTKSGSPMGELFDHGCDAFTTPLLQVNVCIALGLTPGCVEAFSFIMLITSGLLFAIWEQFVTGTLDFGYITGPTEGLLITCGVFVWTAVKGSSIWYVATLPFGLAVDRVIPLDQLPVLGALLTPWRVHIASWGSALYYFVMIVAVVTVLTNIAHVVTRPRVATHSFGIAVTSLLPNVLVFALVVAYYWTFPTIRTDAPFLLELCYGFFASYTATRLTVSRLCVMVYRPWSLFFAATLLCVGGPLIAHYSGLTHVLLGSDEDAVGVWIAALYALLVIGVVNYLHMIVSVFRQFSVFLKLHIFKVRKPAKPE